VHVKSAAIGSQCSQDCLFQPTLTYSGKQKTYPRRAVVDAKEKLLYKQRERGEKVCFENWHKTFYKQTVSHL